MKYGLKSTKWIVYSGTTKDHFTIEIQIECWILLPFEYSHHWTELFTRAEYTKPYDYKNTTPSNNFLLDMFQKKKET